MQRIIALSFMIAVTPIQISSGQVGGQITHEPELGCACVGFENEEDEKKSSRKLSSEECKKKGDVPTVYVAREVNRRAVIRDQPKAELPAGTVWNTDLQRVVLKVVLCPDRSVGRIGVVLGSSSEINASAIRAARKLRFEVAMKDGKPVAQYVRLEYAFDKPR